MKISLLFFFLCLHFLFLWGQVEFTSSNLPIIIINTNGQEIPDEPKIEADMGIIYNGDGIRNYLTDPYNHYNGKIGIEIRGSSSQMFPKKQYGFETRDAAGENLNVSLLEMPEENDWILYAPYSDKSLLRNVLAYTTARNMDWYASRIHFCELVLNDDYRGTYVLMEKIKRDNNRVDISKLEADEISGDDLTGGYIIKIDKTDGAETEGWFSDFPPYPGAWQQIYYQYHYPKGSEIVWQQQNYIQDFIYNFESMMVGDDWNHPFEGYYDFINVESFIDFFILNELGKNVDGYRLSTFLYKDKDSKGGKLYIGPIWDFNLAFGNADYYEGANTQNWQVDFSVNSDFYQIPFWWDRLMSDPVFTNKIISRWTELRTNILDTDSMITFIDEAADILEESQIRNFIRWPILGEYIWPNAFVGDTYEEELTYLKTWIFSRLYWIDNTFPETYSRTSWISPDSVSILIEQEDQNYILIDELVHDAHHIDSIVFITNNEDIQLYQEGDTLFFPTMVNNTFLMKGMGYYNGEVVVISPAYHVSVLLKIEEQSPHTIKKISLFQNYPNPFNPATTIKYHLVTASHVEITIYNSLGQKVETLLKTKQTAGVHSVIWNAYGKTSGIYFYTLKTDHTCQMKKMILIQ